MADEDCGAAILGVLYQRLPSRTSVKRLRATAARALIQDVGHSLDAGAARPNPSFAAFFKECYETALGFDCTYDGSGKANPYRLENFEWLGYQQDTVYLGKGVSLGLSRHHVLLSNRKTGLLVLETHFAFDRPYQLDQPLGDVEQAISDAIYQLYWRKRKAHGDSVPVQLRSLTDPFQTYSEALPQAATRRVQLHVVCNSSLTEVIESSSKIIDGFPIALYSLLHLHSQGVSRDFAMQNLQDCARRTTDFFVAFCAAEVLLTICSPFPRIFAESSGRHHIGSQQELEAALSAWEKRKAKLPFGHEGYDILPEFPALRYNSHVVSLALLNATYANAKAQRQLRELMNSSIFKRMLVEVFWITSLERMLYRETCLDHVRLSVVREFVDEQLSNLHFSAIEKTTTALRQNTTSQLLAVLTILSFAFLVVPAAYELVQWLIELIP